MNNFHFQAYGLNIRSSVPLSGYQSININNSDVDVEIIEGNVPSTGISHPVEQRLFFQVNTNEIWFDVPSVARFLVQNGERILFEPQLATHENMLSMFLSGPCFAALLMQRNLFVLTGCVLKINDGAVAYIGDNCSGKSSLLTCMMQQGYSILSDGLCVVNHEGMVFPGPSFIEIWDDTAQMLNIPVHTLQSIRPGLNKFRLFLSDLFFSYPLPLKHIYALQPRKADILHVKKLMGSEKINVLQKNIFNKTYLAGFKKNHLYFDYCAKLAQQINMYLVEFNMADFNITKISQRLQDV